MKNTSEKSRTSLVPGSFSHISKYTRSSSRNTLHKKSDILQKDIIQNSKLFSTQQISNQKQHQKIHTPTSNIFSEPRYSRSITNDVASNSQQSQQGEAQTQRWTHKFIKSPQSAVDGFASANSLSPTKQSLIISTQQYLTNSLFNRTSNEPKQNRSSSELGAERVTNSLLTASTERLENKKLREQCLILENHINENKLSYQNELLRFQEQISKFKGLSTLCQEQKELIDGLQLQLGKADQEVSLLRSEILNVIDFISIYAKQLINQLPQNNSNNSLIQIDHSFSFDEKKDSSLNKMIGEKMLKLGKELFSIIPANEVEGECLPNPIKRKGSQFSFNNEMNQELEGKQESVLLDGLFSKKNQKIPNETKKINKVGNANQRSSINLINEEEQMYIPSIARIALEKAPSLQVSRSQSCLTPSSKIKQHEPVKHTNLDAGRKTSTDKPKNEQQRTSQDFQKSKQKQGTNPKPDQQEIIKNISHQDCQDEIKGSSHQVSENEHLNDHTNSINILHKQSHNFERELKNEQRESHSFQSFSLKKEDINSRQHQISEPLNEIPLSSRQIFQQPHDIPVQQSNQESFSQSETRCMSLSNKLFGVKDKQVNIISKGDSKLTDQQIHYDKENQNPNIIPFIKTIEPIFKSNEPEKQIKIGIEKKPEMITVQAQFDFTAQKEGDLTFKKGDKIQVIKQMKNGWWVGMHQSKVGYFPFNFVQEIVN